MTMEAHPFPATLDVAFPEKLSRRHSVLRIALWVAIGLFFSVFGFVFWVLTIGGPIVIALRIRAKGLAKFFEEDGPTLERYVGYFMAALAYIFFVTDESPPQALGSSLKYSVKPGGSFGWAHAMGRPLLLIPHSVVLGVLALAFIVVLPVSAIVAVVDGRIPRQLFNFTVGYGRWLSRYLAYWLSLTDRYPPFSFEEEA